MDHPVYRRALSDGPSSPTGWHWLSAADTAKLVRSALASAFPASKFYVRSDTYSGGASIDVYFDGSATTTTSKDVDDVVSVFKGGRFDGSIDMGYSVTSWLNPDGSATWAKNPGSAGSGGYDSGYDVPAADPRAILVHFGAKYVFVNNDLPYDVRNRVA